MKTLLLLALLSTCAVGQDIDKLTEQYEAECYADSTEDDVHDAGGYGSEWGPAVWATPCWIETDNSPVVHWDPPIVTCRRPDHWKKYWKHREPTYQGFKDFIRRKPEKGRR